MTPEHTVDHRLTIRRANQRGHSRLGWLDSRHTFSFSNYYDPLHIGFRTLLVINDDRVAGGGGFGTHEHEDMEIITYVLQGALVHQDSLGTGSTIKPGDVQRMSAGTGIRHSEANGSQTEVVHFLQIWITPDAEGMSPSYEQRSFSNSERAHQLRLIASRDGRDGSVTVHQDVTISVGLLSPTDRVDYPVGSDRYVWIQVAQGSVVVNGEPLAEGDGASTAGPGVLQIFASSDAEVLVFDCA